MRYPFIASAAAVSVFVLGMNYLGKSPEEQAASFRDNYPTKDSCIAGTAQRITKCSAPNCYSGVRLFAQRCLEQADGEKESFCRNIEMWHDGQDRDIFETHCEPHTPYRTECEKVIGYVSAYCSTIL
ncbi:MAG: hypothetical protein AAFZ58_03115 [Pseudomonadota bacterium]